MTERVKITLDGTEVEVRTDQSLLKGALDVGVEVPHFCYHPGLTVAGNCRMCLVEVEKMPGLQIACNVMPREGMVVTTNSEQVRAARKTVMEFLLINHPLDCPTCDQAGECWLQDYAFEHGRDQGRFEEDKVFKPTKAVGPSVSLWAERCISCTRCVRFLDEVSGTGELTIVNRGDHSYADICPGFEVDNPLAGNVVDVCPVGALCSRDFLYQARVWWLRSTESVCGDCAKGCNVYVDQQDGQVERLRPRTNEAINGYWMCDYGRESYKPLRANRLTAHRVADREASLQQAITAAVQLLQEADSVVGVGSFWSTCEEMYLVGEVVGRLGGKVIGFLGKSTEKKLEFPGFSIPGDRNPNRAGARKLYSAPSKVDTISKLIKKLPKKAAVLLVCRIPEYDPPQKLLDALDDRAVVLLHTHAGALADEADVVFAGSCHMEEDGSVINEGGVLQNMTASVRPPGRAGPGVALLQRLVGILGGESVQPLSAGAIARQMGVCS